MLSHTHFKSTQKHITAFKLYEKKRKQKNQANKAYIHENDTQHRMLAHTHQQRVVSFQVLRSVFLSQLKQEKRCKISNTTFWTSMETYRKYISIKNVCERERACVCVRVHVYVYVSVYVSVCDIKLTCCKAAALGASCLRFCSFFCASISARHSDVFSYAAIAFSSLKLSKIKQIKHSIIN